MVNKVQFRRGTNAERGTVVLDSGEPGWTTDTKELYVGDGATYGGILVTGGAGGGAGTLCKLSDVSCAGTVDGRALTYQAGTWVSRGTVVAEQIPVLPASKITSGTLAVARIPVVDDARIPDLETLSYGAAFATAQIPSVGAYKIASGTLNADRIPALPTARITTGTFNANRIPILPTDRYGSAVLLSGARSLTGDLDFAKHQAKAIALEALGSAPASPATAQAYYNTGDKNVYVYVA